MSAARTLRSILGLAVGIGGLVCIGGPAGASGLGHKGVNVYLTAGAGDADALARSSDVLGYLVWLHADTVVIDFPFEISGYTGTDPHAMAMSPSSALLSEVAAMAHDRGLRAELRPLMYEGNLDPRWRGTIAPSKPGEFLRNYSTYLAPLLAAAESSGVEVFHVSSELDSMVRKQAARFADLVAAAKATYHGDLMISSSHGNYLPGSPTSVGFDFYDVIGLDDSASVGMLTSAIEDRLRVDGLPGRLRDLTLAEVSISASHGAYWRPWDGRLGGPILRKVQKRWFQATCNAFYGLRLAEIDYWMINVASFSPTEDDSSLSSAWVGTASADAIRTCFARSA